MEQGREHGHFAWVRARLWSVRHWRETDAGQTLVEFSLILPLMLVLLFGLIDFGRAFYSWLVVTNAAREGARVGATQQPMSAIDTRITESTQGLDQSKLMRVVNNVQGPRGQPITVDLTYQFQFVTPIGNIVNLLTGGSLSTPTIAGHASMRLE